ncbi:hypothetical protein BH18ACI1_BH18ACI1_23060 [soil metagenome]
MQISDLNEKKTQISLVLPSVMIFLNKEYCLISKTDELK